MEFAEVLEKVIKENREEVEIYKSQQEIRQKFSSICLSFSNFINRRTSMLDTFLKSSSQVFFNMPMSFYDSLVCSFHQNQYFLQRALREDEIVFSLSINGKFKKELCKVNIYSNNEELENCFTMALKHFFIEIMELKTSRAALSLDEIVIEASNQLSKERK